MSEKIDTRNGDECAKEPWMYGGGLDTTSVEVEREETDGDVEGFAGYLMAVNKGAPVPVDRYQT